MDKVKIFDPNLGQSGEYVDHWQCSSCEKIYKSPDSIWCCSTCKQNICDNCKNEIHENHSTIKNEYTICQAHDSDCPCSACNPDLYGFYYPTVDKMETNITMSDDLILLGEGDYNPDMLMAQIPVLSGDFEYSEEGAEITFSDSYQLFSPDETILWRADSLEGCIKCYTYTDENAPITLKTDAFDLGRKIANLYEGMNLSEVINKKYEI